VANTPYRFWKNDSHEGGICTPLIVRWPGVVEAGAINNSVGHFIDVMPTLLELAGGSYPSVYGGVKIVPAQGTSLMPALRGEPLQRKKPLFWQWGRGRAVYDDGWKVVSMNGKTWELFDLQRNRTETKDLADEYPERVKEMAAMYDEWIEQCAKDEKINE
jgi:arylsulfatase